MTCLKPLRDFVVSISQNSFITKHAISDYKSILTGCYRFADGEAMKLINTTRCNTWVNGTCGLQIKIQAPIGARYNSQTCQLIWTESTYSISGLHWLRFSEVLHEVQLDTTMHSVTLQVSDTSAYTLNTYYCKQIQSFY